MKKIIFTTSWDDGHIMDFKLSEMLEKYGLKGTFYIAKSHSRGSLNKDEIIKLSKKSHEIGAHTLTHPELDKISLEQAKEEIFGSKKYLEEIIGKKVEMFCYPRGKYNDNIKNIVSSANFLGARTTSKFCFEKPKNFFEFGVSLHIYPFPFRKTGLRQIKAAFEPLKKNLSQMSKLKLPITSYFSWQNLARNLFDCASLNKEIFHLYGHSWEIKKYGMWEELENFLKYVSEKGNYMPMTNGETIKYFKEQL